MKLPKIPQSGKPAKLSVSISENELDTLKQYANYYNFVYNDSIKENELLVHIIKTFIEQDKDFTKWTKNQLASNTNSKIEVEEVVKEKVAKK